MKHRITGTLLSILLFTAGVLNYRPWRAYRPDLRVTYESEPIRIARSLREEGLFANPFGATRTGETSHIAPGLPSLLFLILKTLGDDGPAAVAIEALPVVALSLQLALLPWLATWFGFSRWTGVLAAIFGLITKPGSEARWEAHVAGLLCLLAAAAFCRWLNRRTIGNAAGTAILAGLLFHFQPVFVLPWFAAVVAAGRKHGFDNGTKVLFVLPLLLCLPWSVRNCRQIGAPFMRDDLGLELYVSFNNCAPAGFQESLARFCIQELHPNSSLREALEVRRLGEGEYNRSRLRVAVAWIVAHPRAAATLIAERFWLFWFPVVGGWGGYVREHVRYFSAHIVTLFSLFGLYLCWKQRRSCWVLFGSWMALFPVIYYVVQFAPRYRYPILWMTWLLAAHATTHGWRWLRNTIRDPSQTLTGGPT